MVVHKRLERKICYWMPMHFLRNPVLEQRNPYSCQDRLLGPEMIEVSYHHMVQRDFRDFLGLEVTDEAVEGLFDPFETFPVSHFFQVMQHNDLQGVDELELHARDANLTWCPMMRVMSIMLKDIKSWLQNHWEIAIHCCVKWLEVVLV